MTVNLNSDTNSLFPLFYLFLFRANVSISRMTSKVTLGKKPLIVSLYSRLLTLAFKEEDEICEKRGDIAVAVTFSLTRFCMVVTDLLLSLLRKNSNQSA